MDFRTFPFLADDEEDMILAVLSQYTITQVTLLCNDTGSATGLLRDPGADKQELD